MIHNSFFLVNLPSRFNQLFIFGFLLFLFGLGGWGEGFGLDPIHITIILKDFHYLFKYMSFFPHEELRDDSGFFGLYHPP